MIISIHSLRVEGDRSQSARWDDLIISIHSLRVEGDPSAVLSLPSLQRISIHSLRVEGDFHQFYHLYHLRYFNPLPPC